jgi:glycosyltransferase involved in cell wall biosynthesis
MNEQGTTTVVIPTYNRKDQLRRTLLGYVKQSSPHLIREIIVVDDGSTDGTRAVVEEIRSVAPFQVRYIFQANRGPSVARNRGIEQVQSRLTLLTDDDMIPHQDLVARHEDHHKKNSESSAAVLGLVEWWPEVRATPFMKWYGQAGPLFGYGQIRDAQEVEFHYFYSCNLSLKSEFLKKYGKFDESFKMAAYEDVELGFRLRQVGMRILYNPQAITYHCQFFTFAQACQKTKKAAVARRQFLQTEAGRHFLEQRKSREASLGLRYGRSLAAALFRPARLLLDTRIPLPSIIYRSLFWRYAINTVTQD